MKCTSPSFGGIATVWDVLVDGHVVKTTHVAEKADVYDKYDVPAEQKGRHTAVATVRSPTL